MLKSFQSEPVQLFLKINFFLLKTLSRKLIDFILKVSDINLMEFKFLTFLKFKNKKKFYNLKLLKNLLFLVRLEVLLVIFVFKKMRVYIQKR